MADNPQIDPGATPSIPVAAEDIGGNMYQRVKLTDGTDESTTPIKAGGGVEADALRVTIASDSTGVVSVDDNGGSITVDGTVAVTNAGLTTLAGAVAGTEMQCDVLTMPTVTVNAHAVTVASGGVASGALAAGSIADGAAVTLGAKADDKSTATDTTPVTAMQVLKQISASVQAPPSQAVTNAGTFATQATLQAGTAEIGKLAAGTAEIGNVKNSGTFAVQAAATLSAETTKVIGTVNIAAAQTIGLAAGTAAVGKLAANSGVDIGDVDVTSVVPGVASTNLGKAEDAGHTSGDVGVMALAVRTDTPAASSGTTGDYEALHTNKLGSVWMQRQGATPFKNIDCDETEDAISANPCQLMGFYAYANVAAGTKRYLKFYNNTVAGVTVGTTVPDMTIELDGTQGIVWSTPLLFATALTVAATTGLADNDTGAPGANEVIICGGYSDL